MIRLDPPDDGATMLKDTAARFVSDRYGLARRAEMLRQSEAEIPAHWADMAGLGWLMAPVPETAGGLGLSPVQVVALLEVLGAGLVLEPVGPVAMHCAATLARALPAPEEALAPVLSGTCIEVMASGAEGAPITATRDGGRVVLSGQAPLVPGGAAARAFWVEVRGEGAPALIRVPAEVAEVTRFRLVDGQAAARVDLDGVTCDAGDLVTGCAGALAFGADMGLVGMLAEASGLIDALYRATLEHVKLREQFGRPIGGFQVVQHRMADMFIAREEVRSMVRLAAEAMESGEADFRARLVSAARVKIADAARTVLRDAVQLHGGMGVTDELPLGHMVKRVLVLTRLGGRRAAHLQRFREAA